MFSGILCHHGCLSRWSYFTNDINYCFLPLTFHLMLLLFSAIKCQMGKWSCYSLLRKSSNYGMKTSFRLQRTTCCYHRCKKILQLPVIRTLNFHYPKFFESFQGMQHLSYAIYIHHYGIFALCLKPPICLHICKQNI